MNIYNRTVTDFNNNGYGFLKDSISSKVTEVLNGELSLSIEYPLNGFLSEYLLKENIIKCNVGNDNYQLFRIKYIETTDTRINVYAVHIFYDLADNMLVDVAPENKSCQEAVEWMLARTQYANDFTVFSDIVTTNTQRYVRRNPVEALIGDIDNSIIKNYNAELERNNKQIKLLSRRGADNHVKVLFGKNIKQIKITEDVTAIYTRIMPMGANGLLLPELFVDSPLLANYIQPKIAKIEFSDIVYDPTDANAYQNVEDAYTEMRNRTNQLYSIYNYDKPSISVSVSWIELSKIKEYYDQYSSLETVDLGDTITVEYKGFLYSTRIVKTIYNVLLDRIETFEMGIVKPSYISSTANKIDDINKTLANPTNILQQSKELATGLITSAMGGFVYKTQNELFIMDDADPNVAQKIWRWNINGLAYSSTGINGTYEIAMTTDGRIVADFITTGSMSISRIEGLNSIISGIETDINLNTDSIQLSVSQINELAERSTEIEATLDGLQQTLTSVGGYNLIKNSVKQFGNEGYTGTFPSVTNTDIQNNSLSKNAIMFMNGSDKVVIQVPNGQFNYSFKAKKLIPLANTFVKLNDVTIEITNDEWVTVDIPINISSNTITIEYISDTDESLYATDCILVPGELKQIWSPNPNETYTETVKIGKGIEVSSNTSNTKTRIDSDGNRILNANTNEVVSEHTDKGLKTNEIESNKGQIAKVLIVDMGTQTWFSRM